LKVVLQIRNQPLRLEPPIADLVSKFHSELVDFVLVVGVPVDLEHGQEFDKHVSDCFKDLVVSGGVESGGC
jgi:hypothetical protein